MTFDEPAAYARTVMVRPNIDQLRRLRRELLTPDRADRPAPVTTVGELDGWLVEVLRTRNAWRKATVDAGVPGFVFHGLRHDYASLLIRHGESVKTVQERLGHASAVETLDTYSHLWPDSDDRTREAVDTVLALAPAADSPRTGERQI